MKLYPDTKIYIFCPGNVRTGGPELCHQLASQLIIYGANAYLYYYKLGNFPFNPEDPVDDAYKKYHVPYTFEIKDAPHNVFVFPETFTASIFFQKTKKARRIIWWMSVNNYLTNIIKNIKECMKDPLNISLPKFFSFDKTDNDIEHWVQSEYARQFIKLNGIAESKIHLIVDYLNQAFLSRAAQIDLTAKENYIAYNLLKGFELTRYFIKIAPDLDWRPIKGKDSMTPAEVQELLAKAKVYIDFGEHPGRDKIPREAAASGCVVIVGKRGSAANDTDVNIPEDFKFGLDNTKPHQVIEKICEVFNNFERELDRQKDFRQRVYDDRKIFAAQVAAAFEIKKFPPPTVAFAHVGGG